MKEFDFVVVGSGIAGLSFALKAAQHGSVAVITKRKGSDSNTAWAQGGIACVTSGEDAFELHVRDTLEAGVGLCDEQVVRTIVTEGPEAIRQLQEIGVHFDEREISGHREPDLGREGGHSKRRVLHVQDVTGREIESALLAELKRVSHVQLLENYMAVDLITAAKLGFAVENRCLGLYALDESTGGVKQFAAIEWCWRREGAEKFICIRLTRPLRPVTGWPSPGERVQPSQTWNSSSFTPPVYFIAPPVHSSYRRQSVGRGESYETVPAKISCRDTTPAARLRRAM